MSTDLLVWIILSPLLAAILNGGLYFYHIKKSPVSDLTFSLIGTIAPFISFLITLSLFFRMKEENIIFEQHLFTWLNIDKLNINMALLGDNLSIFMTMFVTFVGWLIHIYAVGYMKGDKGFGKFFAYFNLFLASMLILVLADNPIILFIGWEGVGVCSYLLIKFYYGKKENVIAANKAFIVNRVGDFGFLLGVITLFFAMGEVNLSFSSIEANLTNASPELLGLAGFLLFVGAMGKSAQVPLYVWLPDAMAGPTPISALIHAATMVTAGVYMVARFHFLYIDLDDIGLYIAYTGAFSALLAAFIATRQNDIKKILAYSTMSQLGYMFIAVGLGFYSTGLFHFLYIDLDDIGLYIAYTGAFSALLAAFIATRQNDIKKILAYSTMSQLGYMFIAVGLGFYSTGLFHVFTHAFFKAMLFMGAGGVIMALHHQQDIFKIAQNRASLPIIGFTFLIGVIAISGIPPFSGFFSKDAILAAAFQEGEYLIWAIAMFTAFLTAFYMFRLYFIVFVAPSPKAKKYVYTPKTVTFPLLVLAIGAVGAGFLNLPSIFGGNHFVDTWLAQLNSKTVHLSHSTEYILMGASILVAAMGILVAYKKYANFDVTKPEEEVGLIGNKFYVDEVYDVVFVKSLKKLSTFIDKVVDDKIIDGFIMNSSRGFVDIGKKVAMLQNANVRFYAAFMLLGMTCIFIYIYITLGL